MKSPEAANPPLVAGAMPSTNHRGIFNIGSSIPDMTYAVQNCNSLNISTVCHKQLTKICALTALCTDIIFISDVRLNAEPEHTDKIKKLLVYNDNHSYDSYFHSSNNARGVGILISKNLTYKVIKRYEDTDENILGLLIGFGDAKIRIFSVYGPNHDNETFYKKLDTLIEEDNNFPIVCGGDWNTTYSTSPTADNIDIINMRNPPSLTRAGWLRNLCIKHCLSDPFRALHPTLRDFSFSPSGARANRSRLDFFLIGDEMISNVTRCTIASHLSAKIFDHKPVFLDFQRNKAKARPFINRTILSNARTDDIVLASFMDTYLTHTDTENPENRAILAEVHHAEGVDPVQTEKEKIGRFMQLIKRYNDLNERLILDPLNNLLTLELAGTNGEIRELKETFWKPDVVLRLKLTANPDTFLEVLMSNIKGNVISFQHWVKKTNNLLKSSLVSRLNELKTNYEQNADEIVQIESRLCNIVDEDISAKVKSMKLFECLNAEKPTPLFMSLARSRAISKKLAVIRKPDGTPYDSPADQVEGIVNYYADLYKKPPDERINYTDCVADFLGPDIVQHPIVQGSMLSEQERQLLDSPLTQKEIDDSMEQANTKSAPGIDGISNTFLKKYWEYIGTALFNYATHCFNKGILTANFRTASIKLIPKKGGLESLKNWRPISLLSNLYKIISRAINNRLNKIVNRVCSRAQKGFNDSRYTQEVLINVIETIRHCNNKGISGAVVAVDMAKAFDTLSHGFLTEVFKFFNFGPNIIKWLNLLGTGRSACIILDDCSYSKNFDLERGRAQGDNISPNTFNFGDQILILKIELDPAISAVWQHMQLPNFNMELAAELTSHFAREAMRETSKNESLADDNTTLTVLNSNNLARLREILNDFGDVSGLRCNFEKTCVLPVGPPVLNVDYAGFHVVDRFTLLGMEITKEFENTNEIFLGIHEKIVNHISFWERFRLTLPGRISVIKTLLIPQINYLGSFLTPTDAVLNTLQSSLDRFALSGQNVAEGRRYLPPKKGGLGLFKLKPFLDAQRCSWVKRAYCKPIDNWRFDLKSLSPGGDISAIRKLDVCKREHPILYNIVESYSDFMHSFALHGKNYRKSHLFMNPIFVRSGRDNGLLDTAFFTGDLYTLCSDKIRLLTFDDCFNNHNFKTRLEFHDMGIPMNNIVWMRLQSAVLYAKNRYSDRESEKYCKSLGDFMTCFKKGSKKFRNILMEKYSNMTNPNESRTVQTFATLTDTEVPDSTTLGFNLSLWNCTFLPNDMREFLFKERNNSLPLGTRIAHFLENINEKCSFCRIINPDTHHRESFNHFFLDCPVTRANLNGFLRISGSTIQGNHPGLKNAFWYGLVNDTYYKDVALIFSIFRFCMWKFKIRKIFPRPTEITGLAKNILNTVTCMRPKLIPVIIGNNYFANLLQARG